MLRLALLVLVLAGCAPAPPRVPDDWQRREAEAMVAWRNQGAPDNQDLRLRITAAARLDERVLLLGGALDTQAAPVRSLLLRSVDDGATWQDTGVFLAGSTVWSIAVLDARHAWVVHCWGTEGLLPPFSILATTDGGATWRRSRHDLPFGNGGLPAHAELVPIDERRLLFVYEGTGAGDRQRYLSADGGSTWRLHGTGPAATLGLDPLVRVEEPADAEVVEIHGWRDGDDVMLGRLPARWPAAAAHAPAAVPGPAVAP